MISVLMYLTIPVALVVGVLIFIRIESVKGWQYDFREEKAQKIRYNPPRQLYKEVRTILRYFKSKQSRNKAWRQLTDEEKAEHCRRVHKNLVLHPTRVDDYEGTLNGDKEYGEEIPVENFSRIYSIEPRPPEF